MNYVCTRTVVVL